jgi:Protein kinase domain
LTLVRVPALQQDPTATLSSGSVDGSPPRDFVVPARDEKRARLAAGTMVGRYRVSGFLGEGGMGVVYRARDTELAREVALKLVDVGKLGIELGRERLRREAQAMARIEHPAVVHVYDVGVADGHLFVALELVVGATLAEWLHERARSWREVLAILIPAGRGIAAAHRASVIHRDIKPSNILLDGRGTAKVTDFGVAKTFKEEAPGSADGADRPIGVTRSGSSAGTPAYMAPEQFGGAATDARADQFAFCVTLWEALCGKRPRRDDAVVGTPSQAAVKPSAELRQPSKAVEVPRRVLAVVERGMARERARRWATMDELLDALQAAARPRRNWVVGGALLLIAVTIATLWLTHGRGAPPRLLVAASGELIARTSDLRVGVTMLRDRRIVRIEQGQLVVVAADGLQRRTLTAPAGVTPTFVRASSFPGSVSVFSAGRGCRWWRAPVDGGAWQLLLDDGLCDSEVDLSPDGAMVAMAMRGEVILREVVSGRDVTTYRPGAEVGELAWSPDGTRVAVEVGSVIEVVDAREGRPPLRVAVGGIARWFDADRLLYLGNRSNQRSEVRLHDLTSGADTAVLQVNARVDALEVGRSGIFLLRRDSHSRLYVAPTSSSVTSFDALVPLDTGAVIDFGPATWTTDGAVVSLALMAGQRGLVRTTPGRPGVPLVLHPYATFSHGSTARDHVLLFHPEGGACEYTSVDVESGQEHGWRDPSCLVELDCGSNSLRCWSTDNRWFDAVTLRPTGSSPPHSIAELLSPDATESVRLRGRDLVIRTLATGAETVVVLRPPLDGPLELHWGPDPTTILAFSSPSGHVGHWVGHERLLQIRRDGTWRVLADDPTRALSSADVSPDGQRVAVTAIVSETTWEFLPFLDGASP